MLRWKWNRKISAANQRNGDLGGLKVRLWIWIKYMIFIFSQVQTTKNERISTRSLAGWPSSFELWVDFEDPEGLWALLWNPTENSVTTSHPLRRLGFYLWCFNWKKHEIKSISKMSRTFPSSKESSESWNSFHSSCFPPRKVNPLKSCLVGTPVGNQQTYQTWVYSSAWVTGWS